LAISLEKGLFQTQDVLGLAGGLNDFVLHAGPLNVLEKGGNGTDIWRA
jgi:hypothetical protein